MAAARLSQNPASLSTIPPPRASVLPRSTTPRPYAPGIRDTRPSTPAARAKSQSIDNEVDSKRFDPVETTVPADGVFEDSLSLDIAPRRELEVLPSPPPALLTPIPTAKPEPAAAARAPSVPPSARQPYSTSARLALWLVTATIPAIVVFAVMRAEVRVESARATRAEKRAAAEINRARAAFVRAPASVAEKPANPAIDPPALPSVTAATSSAPASDSASIAASTVPVVVETESLDRVSVLVKSKPRSARVYKRGKEIGRTPLVIQIGRGEHRIFEVGVNLGATRRISLDGEKPEITVTLVAPEVRPAASATASFPND